MKKDNIVQIKSYAFAIRIIKFINTYVTKRKNLFSSYLDEDTAQNLLNDTDELLRIIGSIQKTLRNS
jgi:hypothetical protein